MNKVKQKYHNIFMQAKIDYVNSVIAWLKGLPGVTVIRDNMYPKPKFEPYFASSSNGYNPAKDTNSDYILIEYNGKEIPLCFTSTGKCFFVQGTYFQRIAIGSDKSLLKSVDAISKGLSSHPMPRTCDVTRWKNLVI